MRYLLKAPKSEYTQVYVCNTLCCLQTRSSKRVLLIFTALQMVLFSMCLFIAHTLPILQATLPNIICTPFCARFCHFFSFSAMFCHLNFCQMMLAQFSTLQSLPYFNFILIFCHLILFFTQFAFISVCREKNLMFPLPAVASCQQIMPSFLNFSSFLTISPYSFPWECVKDPRI